MDFLVLEIPGCFGSLLRMILSLIFCSMMSVISLASYRLS